MPGHEAQEQAFYDDVLDRTLQAQARTKVIERRLDLAGIAITLVFAGPQLDREFMGALGHLVTSNPMPADATFHIWDSASTGVSMSPPPCAADRFTDRGDIQGFSSARLRTAFHWSECSVSVYDTQSRVGAYWIHDSASLPYWARSSPLRTLFHWVTQAHGLQLLHGAGFGDANDGVLVVGKGGVGKSTTSLAALSAGLSYVGDDYLVVGLTPTPTLYALYSTAKLDPRQLTAFPKLGALAEDEPQPGEKALVRLYPALRDRVVRSLPLRYLLTPRFADQPTTTFEAIPAIELHRAAAFTTLAQLPHVGAPLHTFIDRLIDQVPHRRVALGRDVSQVPQAVRDLLAGPPPPAKAPRDVTPSPLITVVIPIYNGTAFLADAIANVLAQDMACLEIFVVDDGSTDDIEGAVAALPVEVRFLRQENRGPAAARNLGVRAASGEYLAFLDVDDLWPQATLHALLGMMDANPYADVVLGRGVLASGSADALVLAEKSEETFPYYIGSALYRRAAFARIGLFDERMRYGEDSDWFQRAMEAALTIERVDRTTLNVRRHLANMTRGKSMVELNALRVLKNSLDRRRARVADACEDISAVAQQT